MRIESGYVGMESARSAGSLTAFSGDATAMRRALQGRGKEMGSFQNLLSGWASEGGLKGTGQEDMPGLGYTNKGTYAVGELEREDDPVKKLNKLRQQCVLYLLELLFGVKSCNKEEPMDMAKEEMDGASDGAAGSGRAAFSYYHTEYESIQFETQGMVRCADGREISFGLSLEMSRSFAAYYEQKAPMNSLGGFCDPLVIQLDGSLPNLSDQKFYFDLDQDGEKEQISYLGKGSGFLALDRDGNGKIDDGSELFGTKSGDGFKDLAAYDDDKDGWIDEDDAIWEKLKIWVKDDTGNDKLYSLRDLGVGAIGLQNANTQFSLNSMLTNQTNGKIARTGVFLYENGKAGLVQHIDLAK